MLHKHLRLPALKITGERGSTLKLARGRLVLVAGFFVVIFMLVAARAIDVTVLQGGAEELRRLAGVHQENKRRGDIFDRNGVLLATTLKTPSLYADPKLITDPEDTARKLAMIFPDESYNALFGKLKNKGRFVWIKRNITPAQQQDVLTIGQPGLEFQEGYTRIYPQGAMAAHLVGYTSIDNRGLAGVERSYDEILASGENLELALDVRLQHALRREILAASQAFEANAGAGVVLDVKTGEVLAGVSWPDFEPYHAGDASGTEKFNRLTLGVYELGSLFKIFSTAAVLEFQNLPMNASFDVREPIKMGYHTISDFHAEGRILTVPEVFMFSSNIGSARMGEMVGTEALRDFYDDLGLLERLDWDIEEAGRPLVPFPWREINTLTASYGHGIATTPLQMSTAVASIVNGGYLVKPRLVRKAGGQNLMPQDKNKTLRIVSEKTAHRMRQLMRLVVTDGTGSKADVMGYRVAGKTGTAEKIGEKGGYDRDRLLSSFIGMFPAEAPRYVVLVMIDEPKGNKASYGYATAGWVAAPAVARVIAAMGAILGIPQEEKENLGNSLKQYVMSKEDREHLKQEHIDASY